PVDRPWGQPSYFPEYPLWAFCVGCGQGPRARETAPQAPDGHEPQSFQHDRSGDLGDAVLALLEGDGLLDDVVTELPCPPNELDLEPVPLAREGSAGELGQHRTAVDPETAGGVPEGQPQPEARVGVP